MKHRYEGFCVINGETSPLMTGDTIKALQHDCGEWANIYSELEERDDDGHMVVTDTHLNIEKVYGVSHGTRHGRYGIQFINKVDEYALGGKLETKRVYTVIAEDYDGSILDIASVRGQHEADKLAIKIAQEQDWTMRNALERLKWNGYIDISSFRAAEGARVYVLGSIL